MKNPTFLLLLFLSVGSVALTQPQNQNNRFLPDGYQKAIGMQNRVLSLPKDGPPAFSLLQGRLRASGVMWEWDSIINITTSGTGQRMTRNFNNFGLVTRQLYDYYDGVAWHQNWRHLYSYDDNLKITSCFQDKWDNTAWSNYDRWTYSYDASGNLTAWNYDQFISGAWSDYYRTLYTYDELNRITHEEFDIYVNNAWESDLRITYTYDNEGNLQNYFSEEWISGYWVNKARTTLSYDSHKNILTNVEETWEANTWTNFEKITNTYDLDDRILNRISEGWQAGSWVNQSRYTWSYDDHGNAVFELQENWDPAGQNWASRWRYTWAYDVNQNMQEYLSQFRQSGDWVSGEQKLFTYDVNGNSVTGTYNKWLNWSGGSWVPDDGYLELYSMQKPIDTIGKCHTYSATYKSGFSGTGDLSPRAFGISVSPNPANDKTCVFGPASLSGELAVMDIRGRQLMKLPVTAGKTEIDLRSLTPGVYLIKLISGERSAAVKFVKK